MKNVEKAMKVVTLAAIVCFAVVSACECFTIVGVYMIDYIDYSAGDRFVDETMSNSFLFMLVLSVAQICLLFSKRQWARVVRIVLAGICMLGTLLCQPLCNALRQVMGGIIGYRCETTRLGYVAYLLSVMIVFLQICMFRKHRS